MLTIPINPYPNQTLTVMLAGQKCVINIRQKSTGVYVDVTVNNKSMIVGQICLDRVPVLFADYRGFMGTLQFTDRQGNSNPDYTGFNTRWFLEYYQ